MPFVFDTCALIAYLRGEPGAPKLKRRLESPDCFVHAANACELFYKFAQASDEKTARLALEDVRRLGLLIRPDLDSDFVLRSGQFKLRYPSLSLADCFALALAHRLGGTLVTSDREFRRAAAEVRMDFFR